MSSIATAPPAIRALPSIRLRSFFLGLGSTLLLALVVATAAAIAIGVANDGRVLPGVRIGDVSLAGLDRAALEQRLRGSLPPLSTGSATLVVGGEDLSVPFAQLSRGYELSAMADQAFGTGRDANPIAAGIARLRDALVGTPLALRVAYDPAALDRVAAQVAAAHTREPVEARVILEGGSFIAVPGRDGTTVTADEVRAILGAAAASTLPGDVTLSLPVSVQPPVVTTAMAQDAVLAALAMTSRPLELTDGTDGFTIGSDQLATLIAFGDPSGGYTARVEPNALDRLVAAFAKTVDRPAKDAGYAWGAKITVVPSVTGRALDQASTANLVRDTLASRAAGTAPTAPLLLTVAVTQPKLTTEAAQASVPHIVRIGTWTTHYIPGISNGYGVNISIPAQVLNGKVIPPGGTLDFWRDIGPVSFARGYRMGGAIINGVSEHTGALAGGICSTSTTLFNAALRAGLQMGARANHFYYISRYPVGLDATVIQYPTSEQTMSWTNDTPYPVIIRSYTAYGIVRFDLYSVPTGRTVQLTTPIITNRTYGHDTYEYTTSLAPGAQVRLEPIYNGFDAYVTRYVRDRAGNLIHVDHYFSHYHAVNGVVLVGVAAS